MEIIITNGQRRIPLKKKKIELVASKALRILRQPKDTIINISFVGRQRIRSLNRRYFGKDSVTDVIALGYKKGRGFYSGYLGDILICPEAALGNSKKYNNSLFCELKLYVVHGLLHLLGYDDTTKSKRAVMQKKERALLKKL